ncbi:MAG: leucine-rich repeat protein [Clostridium sp.]
MVLPKPVSFIKAKSFAGCESLKKIHLTNKVYAIGDGAFKYSGLKSIHLKESAVYWQQCFCRY